MSDLLKTFFGDAKRLKLSDAEKMGAWANIATTLSSKEKAESFGVIAAHMRDNPIVTHRTPVGVFSWFSLHRVMASALCVLLLVGAGGGVVYGAEQAMPDDLLYPVKLHVNEPFMDMVHRRRSPERRAEWEARKLERRMHEARHLSERPEALTPKRRAFIEEHLEKRVEHLEKKLEQVPPEKQEKIRLNIEKKLQRHEEVLDALPIKDVPASDEIKHLKNQMQQMRKKVKSKMRQQNLPPDKVKPKDLPIEKPLLR